MVHNEVDVLGSDTGLINLLVRNNLLGGLSGLNGVGSGLLLELLGLLLLHACVGVLKLEFTEDSEGLTFTINTENLGVVDNEDKAITLAESNTGDTVVLLHTDLKEGLAALLLTTVKLGAVLVLELGHIVLFSFLLVFLFFLL